MMKRLGPTSTLLIALVSAGLVFVLAQVPPLRTLEARYADSLMTASKNQVPASPDIVIINITEETLAKFSYRSPLDRGFIADVIEKVLSGNPIAIGLDVIIDQQSESEKDRRLFALLAQNPDKIFTIFASKEDGLSDAQFEYESKALSRASKAIAVLAKDPSDGIVRHFLESRIVGENVFPSLAHAVGGTWDDGLSNGFERIVYKNGEGATPNKYTSYPAHAVAVLPAKWFEKKYVLIGVDLPNSDTHRTPFVSTQGVVGGTLPGVVIHAHILDQLLSKTKVYEPGAWLGLMMGVAGAILALLVVGLRRSIWLRMGSVLIAMAMMTGVSYIFYSSASILVPTVPTLAAMMIAGITGSTILWQRDRNEKRFVRQAWSQYLSPQVVEEIVSSPGKLELGGEEKDVSFIFTDIAGFTSMTESTSPAKMSRILNGYLDRISAEFVNAGATLDKIVGDAVIGFIGAPNSDPDHPKHAVELAIAIDAAARQYQKEMAEEGYDFGHTRIGVHSGPAIIGNFGGSRFFDYTALGDTVNTAARLESANKRFGTRICVSGATAARASNQDFRPLGRLLLAGKTKPVEAFEPLVAVLGESVEVELYKKAYQSLDMGNKDNLEIFQNLAAEFPHDYLVACHLGRLKDGHNSTLIDLTGAK